MLDLLIGTLLVRVENERDLDAAAPRPRDACRVALDTRYLDLEPRKAMLGEDELELAVTTVTDLTRPPEEHYLGGSR